MPKQHWEQAALSWTAFKSGEYLFKLYIYRCLNFLTISTFIVVELCNMDTGLNHLHTLLLTMAMWMKKSVMIWLWSIRTSYKSIEISNFTLLLKIQGCFTLLKNFPLKVITKFIQNQYLFYVYKFWGFLNCRRSNIRNGSVPCC